nr:asparagine synthase-related protein [Leucobacter insecticola]
MWPSVSTVPPGSFIIANRGAPFATELARSPQESISLSFSSGSEVIREELRQSVKAHSSNASLVSADVSGIDSACVASIGLECVGQLEALTMASRDPGDDDLTWSRQVVGELGSAVRHTVIEPAELPFFYDHIDISDSGLLFDEPTPTILDIPRQVAGYLDMAKLGSRTHFTGMGGDHLFTPLPQHYLGDPVMWWKERREARTSIGVGLSGIIRGAFSRRTYSNWLRHSAHAISSDQTVPDALMWEFLPSVPSWVTTDARAQVAAELLEEGHDLRAGKLLDHLQWNSVQSGTEALRPLEQATAALGVHLASPYFDDRVARAAFGLSPRLRYSLRRYKPLLAEVASPFLSDKTTSRNTKGMAVSDEYRGLEQNAEKLIQVFTNSVLSREGLIDEPLLRRLIQWPTDPRMDLGMFDQTLAVEMWARAQREEEVQWGRV